MARQKFIFFILSWKNGDHERPRMINVFILCDLIENFRKLMQQTEKEALNSRHVISFIWDGVPFKTVYNKEIEGKNTGNTKYNG